jgi:hypothetical protein
LGGFGSKGAIFFHCVSVSNGPDRAIDPPSALLTLLISQFTKLNHRPLRLVSGYATACRETCSIVRAMIRFTAISANSFGPAADGKPRAPEQKIWRPRISKVLALDRNFELKSNLSGFRFLEPLRKPSIVLRQVWKAVPKG